jgi:hypothetical protein
MTRTDITFDSAGTTLAGHLYTYTPDGPAGRSRDRPSLRARRVLYWSWDIVRSFRS